MISFSGKSLERVGTILCLFIFDTSEVSRLKSQHLMKSGDNNLLAHISDKLHVSKVFQNFWKICETETNSDHHYTQKTSAWPDADG